MSLYATVRRWIKEIPDHLKTQQMCDEAFEEKPYSLKYVPDHLKTKEMCERAVEENRWFLEFVPGKCKTQKMCKRAVEDDTDVLEFVPDHFKTQEMCEEAVEVELWALVCVPDWFVREQQIGPWDDDDAIIKWYNDYKKRKAQKAKIKEEILATAWHPDRVMDWCIIEDKKERWK